MMWWSPVLRDQTALNIRERGGRRKQLCPPEREDGHLRTMGVAVLRTAMSVQTIARSADQLIITFTDMTQEGGDFTIWFDDQLATVPFRMAR